MTRNTVRTGWNTLIALLASALTMLALSHMSRADGISWETNWDVARAASKASGKPLMVDFYTDWCGWCKKLDADVYPDPQVVALSHRFVMLKLNAEHEGAPQAAAYKVHSYPSVFFFNPNGSIIQYVSGYSPAPAFAQILRNVVGVPTPAAGNTTQPSTVIQFAPSALSPQARQQVAAMRRAAQDKTYSHTYVLDDDGSAVVMNESGAHPTKTKVVAKPKAKTLAAKSAKVAVKKVSAKPAPAVKKKVATAASH